MDPIKLVQGDTRPQIIIDLTDQDGNVIDCTLATVRMHFRRKGIPTVLSTINGVLLTGRRNPDGTITTTAPYNVAGAGGRASFSWPVGALDVEPGPYEGEVEIVFADSTRQTVFDPIKFKLRADFA